MIPCSRYYIYMVTVHRSVFIYRLRYRDLIESFLYIYTVSCRGHGIKITKSYRKRYSHHNPKTIARNLPMGDQLTSNIDLKKLLLDLYISISVAYLRVSIGPWPSIFGKKIAIRKNRKTWLPPLCEHYIVASENLPLPLMNLWYPEYATELAYSVAYILFLLFHFMLVLIFQNL